MTPAITPTMNLRDWARVVVLSILWGGSFLFIGVAVQEMPPLTIVALRVLLAAVVLQAMAGLMGMPPPRDRRVWAAFFGMSILNNVIPFTLIVWGQRHIGSGLASILNATTPLFTVLLAHWLTTDERMTGRRLGGVLVGFAGVAAMIGGAALDTLGIDVVAQVAVLAATFSYALSGIFGRRFKALGVPPMTTAAGQVTASSLILVPTALIVDQPWALPVPSWQALSSVAALAWISTALAYVLFFRILASAGATNVALVTFLIPVSAILFGVLLLGERLEPRHFAGLLLIGAGLALIDGRALAALSKGFNAERGSPGSG